MASILLAVSFIEPTNRDISVNIISELLGIQLNDDQAILNML